MTNFIFWCKSEKTPRLPAPVFQLLQNSTFGENCHVASVLLVVAQWTLQTHIPLLSGGDVTSALPSLNLHGMRSPKRSHQVDWILPLYLPLHSESVSLLSQRPSQNHRLCCFSLSPQELLQESSQGLTRSSAVCLFVYQHGLPAVTCDDSFCL